MGVTLLVLVADRVTKLLVVDRLAFGESVSVVPGFFDLVYVRNNGAAFGILSFMDEAYRVPFFAVSAVVAIGLVAYFMSRARQQDVLLLLALSLITGGALGNLYDRLAYGYVIDFIDWYAGDWHWPAFNIADSGITVGIILLGEEVLIRNKTAGQ